MRVHFEKYGPMIQFGMRFDSNIENVLRFEFLCWQLRIIW